MGRVRKRLIHNNTSSEKVAKYAEIKLRRAYRAGCDVPQQYLFDKLKDIGEAIPRATILARLNADENVGKVTARHLGTHWNMRASDFLVPAGSTPEPVHPGDVFPAPPHPPAPLYARSVAAARPSSSTMAPAAPNGLREGMPDPLSGEEMATRRAVSYACEPPGYFCCPVACDLLEQPAALPSGHLFELTALLAMVEGGTITCPLSKRTYDISEIAFVYPVREAIDAWKAANRIQ